jgi:hypothetical protein
MDSEGASNCMSRIYKTPCEFTHLDAAESQMSGCWPQLKTITKTMLLEVLDEPRIPSTLTTKMGSSAIYSRISAHPHRLDL